MAKVEALDHAKRQAAASFARMASDPVMHAEVVRDEQEVLRARVDVLNTLMKNPDAKLCLEASTDRKGVCVTYDRVRCEGELELGPMQSTMAWAVRGAEDTVLQLMSTADNAGHAPVVKSLLQLVQQSAPRKDILQGLHTVLSLPPPERLVLRSLAGMDAQACDAHTRVFEGLGEATGVPPLYRVVWGALDLNVLEGWQNPSTNACVRLSILDTAHQAAREAQQTKAPAWSNVAFLQVRIFHGEECHTLTLRPFCDSESCTVTHLQYRQSVFDDSGPERGILNLSQDPASIHPIPLGKVLPIQAYVCLGAHRKSRLNEAQLNYVHAQGLLAHGFKTEYLPDPAALLRSTPGKMVPAKATRVSGDKLDVMASSYHVADQVYTTISVVQYPPFGTQFGARKLESKHTVKTKSSAGLHPVNMPICSGRLQMDNDDDELPDFNDDFDFDAYAQQRGIVYDATLDPESEEFDQEKFDAYMQHRDEYSESEEPEEFRNEPAKMKRNGEWTTDYRQFRGQSQGRTQHHTQTNSAARRRRGGRSNKPRQFPTELPLYKIERDFESDNIPRSLEQSQAEYRPANWTFKLRQGEHYFVDGVVGNPYILNKRFILFELDNGNRYLRAEATAAKTKAFFKSYRSELYNSSYPFYWNILFGTHRRDPREESISETWQGQWQAHISRDLDLLMEEIRNTDGNPRWFWYTEDNAQWDKIIAKGSEADFYPGFSEKLHQKLLQEGTIQYQFGKPTNKVLSTISTNQIPLPKTVLSARQAPGKPIPELATLQTRIDALESKLSRTKQEANTQHLLLQVLEKLEDSG